MYRRMTTRPAKAHKIWLPVVAALWQRFDCPAAYWISLRLQGSCKLKSEFRILIYTNVLCDTARFFIALFSLILYHSSCRQLKREKEPIRPDSLFLSHQQMRSCKQVCYRVIALLSTPVLKQSSIHLHCYDKKESDKLQPYSWKKFIKIYFWSLYEGS